MNTVRQDCETDTALNPATQGLVSDVDVSRTLIFVLYNIDSEPGLRV